MSAYLVVKNRHSGDVPVELMLYLGASGAGEDAMSGQGFGTKYSATLCLSKGIEFAKASSDEAGPYVCHFAKERHKIVSDDDERVVLMIERNGHDAEILPMTALVRMAGSGWGSHPLGDDYAIVREMVIDAADRDHEFKVELTDEIVPAPKGQTWTYVTATSGVRHVFENFDYYFKRKPGVRFLDWRVGITPTTAQDETRIFLTSKNAPVAYVAWTNDGDSCAEAAYDYVLVETPTEKLASLPKRFLEQEHKARLLIHSALRGCDDVGVLKNVIVSAMKGGWERDMWWEWRYWKQSKAVIKAISSLGMGPVALENSVATFEADRLGKEYIPVTREMYALAKEAGMVTMESVLNTKQDSERITPPTADDRKLLHEGLSQLYELTGRDCTLGHIFMTLQSKDVGGSHMPNYGGKDVITINFNHARGTEKPDVAVAKTILHELGHHLARECGDEDDYHSVTYVDALIDFLFEGGE